MAPRKQVKMSSDNKNYLVTGAAGSGKSTLERLFADKGYKTADIDKGFAQWRNKETGKIEEYRRDPDWLKTVIWSLKVDKLKEMLDSAKDEPVIVFGSANDLHEHLDLFDKTFLLEYPDEESIKDRLMQRRGDHFGKTEHEVKAVLDYYKEYQERMKQSGAQVINCMLPIEQVVLAIEGELK